MRSLRRFLSHWQNWLGLILALSFIFVALAAPVLSPPNATTQGAFKKVGRATDLVPHPPSETAILGTLPGQIDVFHALIWGARDAVQFGLLVAVGAFFFGIFFGAVAGYSGGIVNNVMMRIADAFLTFPALAGVVFIQQLVAITIESMGGTYWFNFNYHGLLVDFPSQPPPLAVFLLKVDPILISLIIFSWMPVARIVNALVITLKNTEFIQAARAMGGSPLWIIRRHLLPNSIGPAIVLAARDVGSSVILQATITFIGLGGASPWGILLSLGRNWVIGSGGDMLSNWWVFLPATLAIISFGIGWNLLGDGLSEVLDPTVLAHGSESFSKRKQKKMSIEAAAPINQSLDSGMASFLPRTATVSSTRIPFGGPPELDPLLQAARTALARQELEQALHAYSHLTKHGRYLREVTRDLALAAQQFPRHAHVWKVLGDVLTQAGNHEYAAKAYEQFKKLTQ